jgi:hypothetical protein
VYWLKKNAERKVYGSNPHVAEELEENVLQVF